MSKAQEALDEIKKNLYNYTNPGGWHHYVLITEKDLQNIATIQELIDKSKAVKPVNETSTLLRPIYGEEFTKSCGVCGSYVGFEEEESCSSQHYNYCPICGTKVQWSDVEISDEPVVTYMEKSNEKI